MVRKLTSSFIHRKNIEIILAENGFKPNKSTGKNELVLLAFQNGLIDEASYKESLNKRTSTLACYFHTHVQDPKLQSIVEKYVKAYSMLFTRGSWLANLACLIQHQEGNLPKEFPTNETVLSIPSFLKDENFMKQAFLPERWLLKGKIINEDLQRAYTQYQEPLSHFLPNYQEVMSDCGWDNALNHMGTSYLGNVKTQICTHLIRRLESFVKEKLYCNESTNKKSLWFAVKAPLSPNSLIHEDDYEWAMSVRNALGLKEYEWLNNPEDLNDYVWTLHHWLLYKFEGHEASSHSILPVSTLNRKYAYIDEKVANSLIPSQIRKHLLDRTENHSGTNLQKLFGLTRKAFNKQRSLLRKKFKAKYKDSKKLKEKWSKIGRGSMPLGATVKMLKTDGVGLRICLEFIPTVNEILPPKRADMFENPFKIGVDTGRVRILTCANDNEEVQIISRKAFYRAQRSHLTEAFEKERMTNTAWGTVLGNISSTGGFKNGTLLTWEKALEACVEGKDELVREQLEDKTRALMSMRRFRWKKSFFDRSFKKIFKRSLEKKQQTVFGLGDGDFASTGRGERSVPTKSIELKIKRFLRMHKLLELVKIRRVNEYNTTKCCHKCHNAMRTMTTKFGNHCLRYRLCTECTKPIDKRRNRDVNASKNIRFLLGMDLQGIERPEAFVRNQRKMK